MALQYSVSIRNAQLNQVESTTGASGVLTIRTGAAPASCATGNSGTVLATIQLPTDWMAAATGGTVAKTGTWQDTSADNTGTAGHFRIHDTSSTTCHLQGSVAATGGDMNVDNTSFASGQQFTVTSFTITAGNS